MRHIRLENLAMNSWPGISIVTPSYNQGKYIAETIESVLAQDYPAVEHIVVDGGSTDGTQEILRRFPHLKIICEPDRGQSDAVNKGFRVASGAIWGFLNSDDTLLPGALQRIAQEIDAQRERHVVMGRCRYIDDQSRYIGIEHTSDFEGHRRILEVWKGHTIPQPATFWTPEVWKTCGPMDESLQYFMDYDLFCRFSQRYRFHFIDQVLATYRLHLESKTGQRTEADTLETCINLSRRYWGPRRSPQHWRLALSLASYRFDRPGRALRWFKQSQEAWRSRQLAQAVAYALMGASLAPEVAFYTAIYPNIRNLAGDLLKRISKRLMRRQEVNAQTLAYMDHLDAWNDGWAGPRVRVTRRSSGGSNKLCIKGRVKPQYLDKTLWLVVELNGREIGRQIAGQGEEFALELPARELSTPEEHVIDIQANTWFVPDQYTKNRDYRPLSWQIIDISIV